MAKTKKQKGTKGGGVSVRQIKSKKERKSTTLFARLATDEWLKGYALFSPDPEAENNPGWYEYLEHYDKPNNQYVPCTGDDCYMCELGENPSGRAQTLFYFPDNPEKERFKLLKLNGYLIRDFVEIDEEEGGVLGRRFRVKRLSDKGEYRVTPQADKPLTKKEIAKLLKEAEDEAKIDIEALILAQAKNALAKVNAVDALTETDDDDDDDEDEDEKPKSRKGKDKSKNSKSKDEDEDEDDDDDEDDDEDEDEDDDSDDDDSDDEDEDDDEDDDDSDDDDDDDDDEDEDDDSDDDDSDDEDEEESDDDDDDEVNELSKQKVSVTSTSEKDEIITGKLDGKGKATKLFVGQGLDVDWDKVKKGVEITVDAKQDDENDWVLTKVTVAKAKAAPKDKKGKSKK